MQLDSRRYTIFWRSNRDDLNEKVVLHISVKTIAINCKLNLETLFLCSEKKIYLHTSNRNMPTMWAEMYMDWVSSNNFDILDWTIQVMFIIGFISVAKKSKAMDLNQKAKLQLTEHQCI